MSRSTHDNKLLSDLGSPVSPLRARPVFSSSSSSYGSVAGKTQHPSSSDSNPKPNCNVTDTDNSSSSSTTTTATSTAVGPNVLPAGNICPSGRVGKACLVAAARTDVLRSGRTGNYGHGSVMRGCGGGGKSAITTMVDPQEVTNIGNGWYKKGRFGEALRFYDRAAEICPWNASCRNNRAAALTGLGRLGEAVRELEEAVRLDPGCRKAHCRLASLHLRLGQVESAQKHHNLAGQQPDRVELQKLQSVERHLGRCVELRKIGDWKSALREADAAIAAGADSSPLLIASRAEALLRLHQLDEAGATISSLPKFETSDSSCDQPKFFGMISDSYMYVVQAQVEMALGRFESAVAAVEKATKIDSTSVEVMTVVNSVRSVVRARAEGNELFKSGNFAEALTAYAEGLKYDPLNPVLYCNRAVCRSKLGQWERSVEDCNEALKIHPTYVKALLRRAASYAKLERWPEAVRDYEILRKELPNDKEVSESLLHAQVALKREEVSNMKFGGEIEDIESVEQFQAAVSLKGVSVVYFMAASSQHCAKISAFVKTLCARYSSLNFLKVDVNECPNVAKAESVRIVPTFKIYKDGSRIKEMICPTQQVLEYMVRPYGL